MESALFSGMPRNALIGNVLELTGRIHEFPPDLVGKLDCRDEIANAKTKGHRDVKHSSIISTRQRREGESKE
jgi:hypothetical protein